MLRASRTHHFGFLRDLVSRWDALALLVVLALVVFLAEASRGLLEPLSKLDATPLSLDPAQLPVYAARTTLRMFAALVLSLLFTLTYATWAAKSRRAPNGCWCRCSTSCSRCRSSASSRSRWCSSCRWCRAACWAPNSRRSSRSSPARPGTWPSASTSRCAPCRPSSSEAAASFHLTPWMRFWQLEVPFALPALIWNMMMSMSGGWFFVVAVRIHQRRTHHRRAARHRLVHRAGDRAAQPARHRLGDRRRCASSSWSTTS